MCLMWFHIIVINQKCISSLGIYTFFLDPNVKSGHNFCIKIIFIARISSIQQNSAFVFLQKDEMIQKRQKSLQEEMLKSVGK